MIIIRDGMLQTSNFKAITFCSNFSLKTAIASLSSFFQLFNDIWVQT